MKCKLKRLAVLVVAVIMTFSLSLSFYVEDASADNDTTSAQTTEENQNSEETSSETQEPSENEKGESSESGNQGTKDEGASQEIEEDQSTQQEKTVKEEKSEKADAANSDEDETATTAEEAKKAKTLSTFAGGDGTETNPYQVATAEQLDAVRNDLAAHYVQTADIDLEGKEWTPIGGQRVNEKESRIFSGSYDGRNHKIQNMTITKKGNLYVGLFGLYTGSISNIQLSDCEIDINLSYAEDKDVCVGGIAGKNCENTSNSKSVDGCSVRGEISLRNAYQLYVGGIVGIGRCSDAINYTDIQVGAIQTDKKLGRVYCGGIMGYPGTINSAVSKCVNYGDITASADTFLFCGGISGQQGVIDYCVNYGIISGQIVAARLSSSGNGNCNIGGIVGCTSSDINRDCVNYGEVFSSKTCQNGTCYAGGYAGYIGFYGDGTISNCYNLGGKISASVDSDTVRTGRIAGRLITENASKCYSYDKTLVNGAIPTEKIGTDQINGGSMSWDEINEAIKPILESLGLKAIDQEKKSFTLGLDNFSFINNSKFFLTEEEQELKKISDEMEYAKQVLNSGTDAGYHISDNAFSQLKNSMEADVQSVLDSKRRNKWGGSCYGMSIVMALRFCNPDLLPLSKIVPDDSNIQSTFEMLAPVNSEDTEDVVNYYQLMQWYPAIVKHECSLAEQVEQDYEIAVEKFLNTIGDDEVPTVLCFYDSKGKMGHSVIALDILEEEDDYYVIKVYDPNNSTEFKKLNLYKHTAATLAGDDGGSKTLRIKYGQYECLSNYVSTPEWMDLRNYVDPTIDHTDQLGGTSYSNPMLFITDPEDFIMVADSECLINKKDGEFKTMKEVYGPFADYSDESDENNWQRFVLDTTTPADEYTMTFSSQTDECAAQLTMMSWAAKAAAKSNQLEVVLNNPNKSIEMTHNEATDMSGLITYKNDKNDSIDTLAIDAVKSKKLLLSAKDNGVLITGDNLKDSLIVIERDGKTYSTNYNGESNEILVNTDSSGDITVKEIKADDDNDNPNNPGNTDSGNTSDQPTDSSDSNQGNTDDSKDGQSDSSDNDKKSDQNKADDNQDDHSKDSEETQTTGSKGANSSSNSSNSKKNSSDSSSKSQAASSAETGDMQNPVVWIVVMTFAVVCFIVILLTKRWKYRKSRNK